MSAEARYQIRALGRALTILRVLNQHNGLNASELSRLVELPRPTVLRLLTTLAEDGYVVRCVADNSFRASRKVRELSFGYQSTSPLRIAAEEVLAQLEQDVVWPLAVISKDGDALYVEALTDHQSRMLRRRDSAGRDLPWLVGSAAHLYLADADEEDRRRLLARALAKEQSYLDEAGLSLDDVVAQIDAARANGYALVHMPTYSSLSVPVFVGGSLTCVLNLRMHASPEARVRRVPALVERLRRGATDLAHRLSADTVH